MQNGYSQSGLTNFNDLLEIARTDISDLEVNSRIVAPFLKFTLELQKANFMLQHFLAESDFISCCLYQPANGITFHEEKRIECHIFS